ncbi:LysR family transcriptional regulator [Rouxiella sp. Mn2063]|uniref:LysR family transcriptional regulator n=1 Tax=Rouxiella sp. Mn2063 TaxID=3395262 RepID=UPI003BEB7ACA
MDNLNGMLAFVRAAESKSFAAAGVRLCVSASAVGKSVARLEARLNVRLFNRSTRRISLTDEGQLFFERCQQIVNQVEEAELEMSRAVGQPRGRLRVSLPAIGYRMLLPYLPEFRQRYPHIDLDLDFSDRMVDLIDEGVDVAIRSGELTNSQMMSRRLGPFRFVIVGSPAYFAQRSLPLKPQDLYQHDCLGYRFPNGGQLQRWEMLGDTPLDLSYSVSSNNLESLLQAALQGLGLIYAPEFLAREYLASGALVSVLAEQLDFVGKFSLVWPSSRHLLPKIRVFIDFLSEKQILGSD